MTARYRTLDATLVIATLERLERRVEERFPGRGLAGVVRELLAVGREAAARSARIRRPHFGLRALMVIAVAAVSCGVAYGARFVAARIDWIPRNGAELLQGTEAAIGTLVFLGAMVAFLFSVETRMKRRRALAALHELRSFAHIVDMHQLTKDPDRVVGEHAFVVDTPSSPARSMTPYELSRYLDYCSETLALISKIAALYVQGFEDPVAVDAVDEIESLATGLSGKIWQKIRMIERTD